MTNVRTNIHQAVPFFRVSNMEAALQFYIDGLGFRMTKKWIDNGVLRWCWIEIGSAALMLQEFKKDGHPAWTPEGKVGLGISICFICEDAIALYKEFRARGIAAARPFVGNGMWVTSVTDPDGYVLEFESLTDAPEETQYVESAPAGQNAIAPDS